MAEQDLKGKAALVTGSTRGIGKGIALVLAEQGADLVLNAETVPTDLDDLLSGIKAFGTRVLFVKADVSVEKDVNVLFEQINAEFGRLDILVNNAGTSKAQDIFETSLDDWNRVIQTNLTSCFLCSKAAMEMMRRGKGGSIVNISSVVGHRGAQYGHVHYAASKSGIFGITKTLAKTGAAFGINVNAVAPGIIETELLQKTHGVNKLRDLAELLQKTHGVNKLRDLAASVPLGLGKVRSVGLAVAFFCGEGGDYLTGTTLDVNGGMY